LFSTSAKALVYDQIIGSLAATRTFQFFNRTHISGSPVKGNATEANFSRRSTPNSKANQPFGNCITTSQTTKTDPRRDSSSPRSQETILLPKALRTKPTR